MGASIEVQKILLEVFLMKGLTVLIGLGLLFGSAESAISGGKNEYPSKETIGLASESPNQHSRAWISNVNNDGVERVAGTFDGKNGIVGFGVAFTDGSNQPCYYTENAQGRVYRYRTNCHSFYDESEKIRTVFVQMRSGNTTIVRYLPAESTKGISRFLSLWSQLENE